MSVWVSMWGLHPTVLGDTGAFSSAPALVGPGDRQGYMPARRTHIGLGSGVNRTTFFLQRRDGDLCVTHTCCGAVYKRRECTTQNVLVRSEPGGISPRKVLRKLRYYYFVRVLWRDSSVALQISILKILFTDCQLRAIHKTSFGVDWI